LLCSSLDISDTFDGQPSGTLRKEEGEEKKDGVGHSLQQQTYRENFIFYLDTRSQPQRGKVVFPHGLADEGS
jgi:hypothetical protein